MPVSKNLGGFGECSSDQFKVGDFSSNQPEVGDIHCDSAIALSTCLMKSLDLQLDQKETSFIGICSDSNNASDNVKREEPNGVNLDNFGPGKSLTKCATYPRPVKGKKSLLSSMFDGTSDSDNHSVAEDLSPNYQTQSNNYLYQRSLSLPTPSKLVSALKGSREKLGTPPQKKLSVSWAPDVYDPIPTSASHVPSRSQRFRNNNKKNGKNKQKGSTRAAKGKDKKKSRKHNNGYSSSPSCGSMDNSFDMEDDHVGCSSVGKSDPFCGHSFLKNSVTRMHFPVAEAT